MVLSGRTPDSNWPESSYTYQVKTHTQDTSYGLHDC